MTKMQKVVQVYFIETVKTYEDTAERKHHDYSAGGYLTERNLLEMTYGRAYLLLACGHTVYKRPDLRKPMPKRRGCYYCDDSPSSNEYGKRNLAEAAHHQELLRDPYQQSLQHFCHPQELA